MKDMSYLEKLLEDIIDIEFFFTKYDLFHQLETRNIESIIRKTKEQEHRLRKE
jgi:hypothetical protein